MDKPKIIIAAIGAALVILLLGHQIWVTIAPAAHNMRLSEEGARRQRQQK